MDRQSLKRKDCCDVDSYTRMCRRFCPHCSENLSYSAYWSLKAKFYNELSQQWTTVQKNGSNTNEIDSDMEQESLFDDSSPMSNDTILPFISVDEDSRGPATSDVDFRICSTSEEESGDGVNGSDHEQVEVKVEGMSVPLCYVCLVVSQLQGKLGGLLGTASMQRAKRSVERAFGVKYSVLCELPYYYHPVRFLIIDPMNSLFLEIAKHAFSTRLKTEALDTSHFSLIQTRVVQLIVPQTVGRIPLRIGAGFSGLTADQWRNWIRVYSYALRGILSDAEWNCWWLFVQACNLFCKRSNTHSDARRGQELLVEYCKNCEELYRKDHLVINMHLSCHILECIV